MDIDGRADAADDDNRTGTVPYLPYIRDEYYRTSTRTSTAGRSEPGLVREGTRSDERKAAKKQRKAERRSLGKHPLQSITQRHDAGARVGPHSPYLIYSPGGFKPCPAPAAGVTVPTGSGGGKKSQRRALGIPDGPATLI